MTEAVPTELLKQLLVLLQPGGRQVLGQSMAPAAECSEKTTPSKKKAESDLGLTNAVAIILNGLVQERAEFKPGMSRATAEAWLIQAMQADKASKAVTAFLSKHNICSQRPLKKRAQQLLDFLGTL